MSRRVPKELRHDWERRTLRHNKFYRKLTGNLVWFCATCRTWTGGNRDAGICEKKDRRKLPDRRKESDSFAATYEHRG